MNIKDYISSGIIETYALGLAGEEESRELEKLCLEYPEIRAAVQEAEAAMENYAQLNTIQPPDYLKEKIWSAIKSDPINEVRKTPTAKNYFYLAIAATILVVFGLPYHFYKMNQYQSEIQNLRKEKNEILVQNETFQTQIRKANKEIDLMISPTTRNIVLAGVAGHEGKQTVIFWSQSGEVYLSPGDLPNLPSDKQYQLWAIIDGQPVSAGLIERDSKVQQMVSIERAEMFAITIEKSGGSKVPSLDQMVVAGKTL